VVAAIALAAIAIAAAALAAGRVPQPAIAVDKATQCVEPADVMRKSHPDLLRHRRDASVRDGARDERSSLAACVECHAGPGAGASAGSVTGHAQAFCESCHRYAAVTIDCFECHRSRPALAGASGAR